MSELTLNKRIEILFEMFQSLEDEPSRLEKEAIIARNLVSYDIKADFIYCLEVLDGHHKLNYKVDGSKFKGHVAEQAQQMDFVTYAQVLQYPNRKQKWDEVTISQVYRALAPEFAYFIEPLFNREFRLGIGKSLLPKLNTTPMLAMKYPDVKPNFTFVITEKLDGNRCIAVNEDGVWNFYSRSGKSMEPGKDVREAFKYLSEDLIYDGELLSPEQTVQSMIRCGELKEVKDIFKGTFNETSGTINNKNKDKKLVYNCFDFIDNESTYENRRFRLDTLASTLEELNKSIAFRVLPILYKGNDTTKCDELLDKIVEQGGEGIMINSLMGYYENKRSKELLKYKEVKTMDMKVIGYEEGTGKYTGMIGALRCALKRDNGDMIIASVGSGLTDYERGLAPSYFQDKIIEVAYFEITRARNSMHDSLRFPRFKRIREDKHDTSEY